MSDVISIWGGAPFWTSVALWLIAFGVVGALLAASGWLGGQLVYTGLVGTKTPVGGIVEGRTVMVPPEPVVR